MAGLGLIRFDQDVRKTPRRLKGVEQRSELADVLQAMPSLSWHRVLRQLLVVPRERVWDVHGARAERDDGRNVRTERVADHHELSGLDMPPPQDRTVGFDVLLAQDLDSLEHLRESRSRQLAFLVEQVAHRYQQ